MKSVITMSNEIYRIAVARVCSPYMQVWSCSFIWNNGNGCASCAHTHTHISYMSMAMHKIPVVIISYALLLFLYIGNMLECIFLPLIFHFIPFWLRLLFSFRFFFHSLISAGLVSVILFCFYCS